MTSIELDREEKKEAILDATFRCVSRHGIDGITLRSIAEEAKINPALLHYYFGYKENLLAEFINHLFHRFVSNVQWQFNPGDAPPRKLETLFRAALNFIKNQRELFVVFIDVWSFCLRNPSLQNTYAGINKNLAAFIEEILEGGLKENAFYEVPKDRLSYHFIALVVGIGIIWHMNNGTLNLEDQFEIISQTIQERLVLAKSKTT